MLLTNKVCQFGYKVVELSYANEIYIKFIKEKIIPFND